MNRRGEVEHKAAAARMPKAARALLGQLLRLCDNETATVPREGKKPPALDVLAAGAGYSTRAARRAMAGLENKGHWLARYPSPRGTVAAQLQPGCDFGTSGEWATACQRCGRPLANKRSNARYCGDRCRMSANRSLVQPEGEGNEDMRMAAMREATDGQIRQRPVLQRPVQQGGPAEAGGHPGEGGSGEGPEFTGSGEAAGAVRGNGSHGEAEPASNPDAEPATGQEPEQAVTGEDRQCSGYWPRSPDGVRSSWPNKQASKANKPQVSPQMGPSCTDIRTKEAQSERSERLPGTERSGVPGRAPSASLSPGTTTGGPVNGTPPAASLLVGASIAVADCDPHPRADACTPPRWRSEGFGEPRDLAWPVRPWGYETGLCTRCRQPCHRYGSEGRPLCDGCGALRRAS